MTLNLAPAIAIAATFTAEPLEPSLAFWTREFGLAWPIEFAPYGQVFQQLLDPSSLLSRNQGGLNVLLVRLEDWGKDVERNVGDLVPAVTSAAERSATPHLLCVCPPSPAVADDPGWTSRLGRMEDLVLTSLRGVAGVRVVPASELAATYPVPAYHNPHGHELGHVPYTPLFFAALGTLVVRTLHALRTRPRKVIVLDCDNTLWNGVCGEDGPLGVQIDGPRRALQEFMVAQRDAGMLLCLCSKNNPEDVDAVFAARPDMPLAPEDIVARRVNWSPKSANLTALADELGLGLDTFVLLDDDPLECAEVKARWPEVLTLQLPEDSRTIPRFLRHVWAFDHLAVTDEDRKRTRLYRQDRERERSRAASSSLEEFLAGLGLEVSISPLAARHLARAAQLTQRTNQFNFTAIRRSEGELWQLCQSGEREGLVVDVSDRFGSYGLVGLMLYGLRSDALRIDTFLLSCRALGRGVEHRMLAHLAQVAAARGLAYVDAPYVETGRNRPALHFLDAVGAPYRQASANGTVVRFPGEVAAALTPGAAPAAPAPAPAPDAPPERSRPEEITTASPAPSDLMRRIATELHAPGRIFQAVEDGRRRGRPDLGVQLVAPRTPVETAVAAVWYDVLGVDRVGIHDNFFELGGHSLAAIQVISRIRDAFPVHLTIENFFELPTVSGLALAITEAQAAEHDPDVMERLLAELEQEAPGAEAAPPQPVAPRSAEGPR